MAKLGCVALLLLLEVDGAVGRVEAAAEERHEEVRPADKLERVLLCCCYYTCRSALHVR